MANISKEQLAHDLAIAYSIVESLNHTSKVVCTGDFHELYKENFAEFFENIESD